MLFDQRGAGRSTPLAQVRGNTTKDLIADLEAIRALFRFDAWMVAGGSWGSCLGLAYAQAHPDRVSALRLHGIFLGRPSEIRWWFHGVAHVFPDHWSEFAQHVPAEERNDLLRAYHTRLMSLDRDVALSAAWHLRNFSARTQTFGPDAAHVARLLESPDKYLPVARLFAHYCMNHAFMPEAALLAGIDRIRHIPAEILQGRYDMVTPMTSAWDLHQAWPEARFEIVTFANHTASPDMLVAQRAASDRLAERISPLSTIDPQTIHPLLDIPSSRSPARAPRTGTLAFISDATGMPQLWTSEAETARPLTDHPEPVNGFAWSPAGDSILFTADCGGDERWQLHLLDSATGTVRALTRDPMTVHMWGAFSPDGTRIAYSANATRKDRLDLQVMDLATGDVTPVSDPAGHQEVLGFSSDGGSLLVRRTLGAGSDQKLDLVEIASGRRMPVLEASHRVKFVAARMLKAGGGLAICDLDGERMALWRFDADGVSQGCLLQVEGCDLDAVALTPDQQTAVVTVNRDGFSQLQQLDLASKQVRELDLPLPGVVSGLTLAAKGRDVLCTISSPISAPAICQIPLAGDNCLTLHGAEPLTDGIAPSLHRVDSFDGLSVPYFLYTPRGNRPAGGWPAVFIIHGGPEMQWRPEWRADVQWLVSQGIMVVAPNVRGSTGYGRAYHGLDDRERRLDSLSDLTALRAHLADAGTVDPDRCGVFGRSYGGYMVMAALTENPDLWRCGVNFYGIGNFFTHLMATGPWARMIRVAEYGDPEVDGDLLRRLSPVNRIDRIRAPLLMVHADRDPRVPPCESEIINSLMFGLGKRCDFLRVTHEGHGFKRIDNIRRVFGALAGFIAEEL